MNKLQLDRDIRDLNNYLCSLRQYRNTLHYGSMFTKSDYCKNRLAEIEPVLKDVEEELHGLNKLMEDGDIA